LSFIISRWADEVYKAEIHLPDETPKMARVLINNKFKF
jgi:hypothetical protein